MTVAVGTRLGSYEVLALIGEGGMGQVYRARDTKLHRDVALKVLPDSFASDPDRLARFTREAQTLASLNHPNIAALYHTGDAPNPQSPTPNPDTIQYLVMELVEGPTLAEVLAGSGPSAVGSGTRASLSPGQRPKPRAQSLPFEDALPIARQIADALEAAHEENIVHRDLKPANVKVRSDGVVKVLDFGLAKAMDPGLGSRDWELVGASQAPTITTPAMMTGVGMILGTAAYMSPEQARGKTVDKRADIWAFGAVLFEMLTGRRAFEDEDVSMTLSKVLQREPDFDALPASVPARVGQALRLCLRKDPKQRIGDIRDVRLALEGAFETGATGATAPALQPPPSRISRLAWMAFAAAALTVAALALPAVRHLRETPPEEPALQLSVPLPANSTVGFVVMSPDGRRLLVTMMRDGKGQIYLRALDSTEWQALPGTDFGRTPFWSPDSRFIGFFADGALKVIPAAGGPARVLCPGTGLGAGGTWSPSGVILFASDRGPLRRVDSSSGTCAVVGKDDPSTSVRLPIFLPDGNHFVYVGATQGDAATRGVYLAALDNPAPRKILADPSSVVYSPPVAGGHAHLLFLRDTTLMAQPFDDATLEVVGDPFPVASQAGTTLTPPQVAASVSNGTLVYLAGGSRASQLIWFDRSGKELGRVGPRAENAGVALSPDGNSALTRRMESSGLRGLWLYDLTRGSESRFLPPDRNIAQVWFPDGRRVLFMDNMPAGSGLYQKDANGGGQPELVSPIATGTSLVPSAFSPDGRFLVYTVVDPKTQADIWYVPWDGKPDMGKAVKFVATDATESQGQVSPNGRWVAYASNESGAYEVYVRPFPNGPGAWKVSMDRGLEPRWSADGTQLYYLRSLNTQRATLMASAVEADGRGGLRIGMPQTLFDFRASGFVAQTNSIVYSPHPDGQRFLVNALVEEGEPTINVITHWQHMIADRKIP